MFACILESNYESHCKYFRGTSTFEGFSQVHLFFILLNRFIFMNISVEQTAYLNILINTTEILWVV